MEFAIFNHSIQWLSVVENIHNWSYENMSEFHFSFSSFEFVNRKRFHHSTLWFLSNWISENGKSSVCHLCNFHLNQMFNIKASQDISFIYRSHVKFQRIYPQTKTSYKHNSRVFDICNTWNILECFFFSPLSPLLRWISSALIYGPGIYIYIYMFCSRG